jgi:hypothetical protein
LHPSLFPSPIVVAVVAEDGRGKSAKIEISAERRGAVAVIGATTSRKRLGIYTGARRPGEVSHACM